MLVLASASPRRQELLRNAGIAFTVQASDIPEVPLPGEAPQDFAPRRDLVVARAESAIPEEEIRAYIATGEPMDKAGAYAIQGQASRWIPRIEGDYANVVGLPVALVYRMLRENSAQK